MKVSLNWLKEFTKLDQEPAELLTKIGAQLGEIENIEDLSKLYSGILIVKVVTSDKHPNADNLKFCKVDDGGVNKEAPRDAQGLIQVVCGAPNVEAGQLAVWLPVGTIIPSSVYQKEQVKLEAKEIRGVVSNGMLASASELAVGDSHEGLVVVNPSDAKPGDSFAEVYKLNDTIIDIENKMFTHRPDLFGELGIAREMAGITGQKFTSPEWYLNFNQSAFSPNSNNLPIKVVNELPELVPRFMAVSVEVDGNQTSPFWLQTYLARVGVRPISLVVDVTNYVMMLTAQPLHAYDYDKLKALSSNPNEPSLVVRAPKESEKLKLLGGKEITPQSGDIMIASDNKLIGVGGVMGGADTEVDSNTKRVVLECATFDMYTIRRTSMANGVFSEAVTRFSKGQSPLQNDRALAYAVDMLRKLVGGKVASTLQDNSNIKNQDTKLPPISPEFIASRLGIKIDAETICKILANVEIKCEQGSDGNLQLEVPFWRTDLHIPEDIVEEVGRLYGYDKLAFELPKKDATPAVIDKMFGLKTKIREILSASGSNELLTYSFVDGQLLDKVGQDRNSSFQLANALSPNLQYYRVSLLPSLLEKVHPNIKTGNSQFVLFEMNKVHVKGHQDETEPDLPAEEYRLAFVVVKDDKLSKNNTGAAYYDSRHYLNYLLNELGLDFTVSEIKEAPKNLAGVQALHPFELVRTGMVVCGGNTVGLVGEPKNSVKRELKLPNHVSMVELDLHKLLELSTQKTYKELSSYPKVEQDVCFRLPSEVSYQILYDLVKNELQKTLKNTDFDLSPIDIYQKSADDPMKQITFRLTLNSYEKTLTSAEANEIVGVVGQAAKQLKATII